MFKFIILAIAAVLLAFTFAPSVAVADAPKKVTICHAAGQAGTTKYVELTISENAVYGRKGNAGHFEENGTPRAGHEQDYFGPCVTATPTPTDTATVTPTPTPTATVTPTETPTTATPTATATTTETPVGVAPPTKTDKPEKPREAPRTPAPVKDKPVVDKPVEELAQTGANTWIIAGIGLALLVGGAMILVGLRA